MRADDGNDMGSLKTGIAGAIATIVGVITATPAALYLVVRTHPQPRW